MLTCYKTARVMAARRRRGLLRFHVSICVEGLSLTFVARCGRMRCPLRVVGFGWLLGVADHVLSGPRDDTRCLEPVGLGISLLSCERFLRS